MFQDNPEKIVTFKPDRTIIIHTDVKIKLSAKKIPNRWYQFWYWALLGLTWEVEK